MSGYSLEKYIYDINHALAYLTECVFFLNNNPIYVRNVGKKPNGSLYVSYYLLSDTERNFKNCDLELIKIKSYNLGFVNINKNSLTGYDLDKDTVIHVKRMPHRIWKYGLHASGIVISYPDAHAHIDFSKNRLLSSNHIVPTLLKEFPSIKKAQENDGFVAFHNHYAIRDSKIYFHLWNEGAVARLKTEEIETEKHFSFLKEDLANITGLFTI